MLSASNSINCKAMVSLRRLRYSFKFIRISSPTIMGYRLPASWNPPIMTRTSALMGSIFSSMGGIRWAELIPHITPSHNVGIKKVNKNIS